MWKIVASVVSLVLNALMVYTIWFGPPIAMKVAVVLLVSANYFAGACIAFLATAINGVLEGQ